MIEVLRTGIRGKAGKSAYELWLESGHDGTEEDYQEWLKGPEGPEGPEGQPGSDGAKGDAGVASGLYMPWEPPLQPNFRSDMPDMFFDAYGDYSPDRAYSQLWDGLVSDNPEWVTKTEIGRDGTGELPIYQYDFRPESYDKKIIVVCNTHGGERLGQYSAYLFFRHMAGHWMDRTDFSYCRNRVRWIVIPNGNPWGYKNQNRLTPGQVNIERNADYRWSEFAVFPPPHENYKGPSVWSEPESVAIRDAIIEHQDALAIADLHFFGNVGDGGAYPMYMSSGGYDSSDVMADVIDSISKDEAGFNGSRALRAYYPTLYSWARHEFGMHGVCPEFDSSYFSPAYSPACNTAALRWYGNILLRCAQLQSKASASKRKQPIAGVCSYSRGTDGVTINISNTSYVDQEQFKVTIPDVPLHGVVSVSGFVVALLGSPLQFWVTPFVGQDKQGMAGPLDPRGDNGFWEVFDRARLCEVMTTSVGETGVGRVCLPFFATFPISPSSLPGVSGPGPMVLGVKMRVTAGVAQLISYRMNWVVTPSNKGDEKVEVYYCKNIDGINQMVRVAPFY